MGRPATTQTSNKAFISTTGMVMLAFVLSRALGLIRDSLLGSAFGASAELDAFSAASRVTDTLYILVAGGALASAFIPTFTAYLVRGERRTAWKIASAITNLVVVGTLLASLVTAAIAPWLVATVLAPGYQAEVQALTVSLLRIMLASTVIFGASGLLMGILNANDHFLLPALAPSLYNAGIIAGIVVLAPRWGIHGVAVGTVLGALLHLLVQLPALRTIDWTYSPILGLRLPGVRNVARLMGPRVLGLAITQLNFWININLASRLAIEGVVSALKLGFSLMLLPQGVVAQAMAVVLFPSFSAQAARKDRDALRTTLVSASQVIIYLTLPATVGLILLSRPIVRMFFQRNAFDSQDVAMVAWALAWYAVGLVAHSQLEIVTRAFYALHDTATPVWVGGGAMALNIVLSLLLMRLFGWLGMRFVPAIYQPWMPLGGLALANSLATIIETLALNGLLRPRLDGAREDRPGPVWAGLGGRSLWGSLWRTAVGATVMAVVLWGFLRLVPAQNAWVRGLGGIVIGAASYGMVTWLLRSPEIAFALDAARSRVTK
jgi:putative peptidoglycan lipid II flippase